MDEETDPQKLLTIQSGNWPGFMNHNWLPSLSRKYGTELVDQRAIWKRYLAQHELKPADLLSDNVHLNAHGEFVMAAAVNAYLRYDLKIGPRPRKSG